MSSTTPSLSTVLLASAQLVQGVLAGKSLTECLTQTPTTVRAAAQAVSFHSLRRLGLAKQLLGQLVSRKAPSGLTEALLLVSLAVLDSAAEVQENEGAFSDQPEVPVYAPHTVVNQAVQAAADHRLLRVYKALINAVLRRYLRERTALLAEANSHPEARWNFPNWWIKQIKKAYPQQWEAILQHSNRPGPLTLRVNQRRCSVARLQALFDEAGITCWAPGGDAVVLAEALPVQQLPGFEQGWWSVQDYAAQQAGALLPIEDGMHVLDACAAPGGKTAHLLERADISLVALDADATRLQRVPQNLQRLGLDSDQVTIQTADAANVEQWWDGKPFDAILADVPCTASGIVRRHPDIRWLRRPQDVAATAALQGRIADALWLTLKPGGYMLYVTCSIFPQEGIEQSKAFLARHPDAVALPSPGQVLPQPVAVGQPCGDGFFYQLLRKEV